MVLNKFVVIYLLLLLISVLVGSVAATSGLWNLIRSKKAKTHEDRRELEKYHYLCSSAMLTGTLVRLVMAPLWFFTLQSLIPALPGAMCLAGVHLSVPGYSWTASSLKVALPGLYLSWLLISLADRRIAQQPFLKLRQFLLLPLIVLLLAETALDIKYLTSVKPMPVSCCTALFDFNTQGITPILTETHWYFIIIALVTLTAQSALIAIRSPKPWVHISVCILAGVLFISLILGLHTKLSPFLLDAPFHHCVFCVLQSNVYVLFGFGAFLTAIYLSATYGLMGISSRHDHLTAQMRHKIKIAIYVLHAAGLAFIGIPTLHKLLTGESVL
ncbi:MAG: hypothetical protein GY874_16565 [Desulfobacteraceae bacterium]|nr:hypothetical protein [Desulfobacteraceae bacterium]